MSKKNQNSYTDEFRKQIVAIYENGKDVSTISKEYGISKQTIYTWIRKANNSGSFRDRDNRTSEENELIELRKENKRLLMENDILKQAALIMARK
jgi:transposase